MKYLIIGLGNPEPQYLKNRHNIGFMVLDHMAQKRDKQFEGDRYGHTLTLNHKGKKLILLKPGTYMNLSGKAYRFHLQKHNLEPSQTLVITDDIALPFGKLRMKASGSNGGHNGLGNIIEVMGTQNYPRLRFGVGNDFGPGRQVDYVLSDFSAEEQKEMPALLDKAEAAVLDFVILGIDRAMTVHNR
ncbi:MAG: aminoacyl-tRNA hydrolase [Bacteroidia bacterium]|nr:aminoacyl-tRNA hydrolase [Bacteroidia bacterium]